MDLVIKFDECHAKCLSDGERAFSAEMLPMLLLNQIFDGKCYRRAAWSLRFDRLLQTFVGL